MRSRISSLGVALPRRSLRREGSVDLAARAANACFADSSYHRREVELLINTGVYRDRHQIEPAMAALIQDRLDIHPTIDDGWGYSFDLLNGGCGMLTGAQVLDAMIRSRRVRLGLVVSSDVNCDRSPDPAVDFPGAGAAFLVEPSPNAKEGFGGFAFETFDELNDAFVSEVDATRARGRIVVQQDEAVLQEGFVRCGASVLRRLAEEEGIELDALHRIVVPLVATDFRARLAAELGVDAAKIFAPDVAGPALSTSTFVAFHRARTTGEIPDGELVALLSVAAGVTVGAAVYFT